MRIIRGKFKGRKLIAPINLPVRPTTDYAKESLFNILNNNFYFDDLKILDCFSGTGNISFEFLSRGVELVHSIDANYYCVQYQEKIKKELIFNNLNIVKADVFKALKQPDLGQYDIIFCDPPYDLTNISEIAELVFSENILNKDGWLIIEHSKTTTFNHSNYKETRKYGNVNFSIFKHYM
jgi:16S rRNA (guanine(966)-N(2))-methyltransferase RsmD